jgi:hypothetical protein
MGSHVDFTHVFSPILLTILRSTLCQFIPIINVANGCGYRVLLASIRDKGVCLCPRCLIPLSRVQNMGMKHDMKQRETLARVDDKSRRRKVATVRDIIYNKNYAVNTNNVETLLMPQSLVPTTVSAQ